VGRGSTVLAVAAIVLGLLVAFKHSAVDRRAFCKLRLVNCKLRGTTTASGTFRIFLAPK
jgi:hypothetical protein